VRAIYDGPIVLAGGLGDGVALHAAIALGCTLGYMGTRFIATAESLASPAYKRMLAESSLDDVVLTRAFTGLPASWLRGSIEAAGYDPGSLPEELDPGEATRRHGADHADAAQGRPARWADIWSAGHSVSAVKDVPTVEALVRRLTAEYARAAGAAAPGHPDRQDFGT
jgi:nitronate monooxygenase